jgi:flagellar biogenesis protein FliO
MGDWGWTMKQGMAKTERPQTGARDGILLGRVAGWLLGKLRSARGREPRLAVLERIALAPRQSLALIEAEGRRFLVATSPEGTPAFYALDQASRDKTERQRAAARVSW